MVLCVVWVNELLPTHRLRAFMFARDRVAFLIVTALDAAQDDKKES